MAARFLISVIVLLSLPAAAVVRDYGANEHQSTWSVSASPLGCRLRHTVPGYGEAVFGKDAGGELGFALHVFERPFRTGKARLLSVPPAWKHGVVTRDLGTVDFAAARPPFRLPPPPASRLIAELERGMFPTLKFKDWIDGSDDVQVHLSAVNVRDALSEFRTCLSDLLPFTFDKVRFSRLQFDSGEAALGIAARQRLSDIARYVMADQRIKRIELDAHTDSRGYRKVNLAVGEKRAEEVREYLVDRGVDPGVFKITSYGEARPIATNRSPQGRALNRRVEIKLIR